MIVAGLFIWASGAPALSRDLFKPPTGLWLTPGDQSGHLYGPTSPDANWTVGQWNIPEELPAFHNNITQNDYARVEAVDNGSFQLSQFGDMLSCTKTYASGVSDVHEFDLFVQPINGNMPRFPRADVSPPVAIGAANSIVYAADVTPAKVTFKDSDCAFTRSMLQAAVVLVDPTRHQVLFLQVRLAVTSDRDGAVDQNFPMQVWYSKGKDARGNVGGSFKAGSFGYDDNITSFGQPRATPGAVTHYSFDMLPRIKQIILDGAQFGLDQDLDNWTLRGNYQGQVSWGHVRASSRWSGIALRAS